MIKVLLFAYLRDGIGKEVEIEYYEGMKVIDIVEKLGLDLDKISIILINGVHKKLETELADGDKLYLFPPVGGG